MNDGELFTEYSGGYEAEWRRDGVSSRPKMHAAGLRAIAARAWDEGVDSVEGCELEWPENPYRLSVQLELDLDVGH